MNVDSSNAALPLIRPPSAQDATGAGRTGSAASGGDAASGQADAAGSAVEGADRFLKLLVAQMRNQDPMNPLDNAQVTSQMAQISTVQGVEKLNASMEKWLARSGAVQGLDSAALIGRRVLVPGDAIELAGGVERAAGARGGFELPSPAAKVRIEVLDAAGEPVATIERTGVAAGVQSFEWDGRDASGRPLPDGRYRMRVSAGDASKLEPAQALRAVSVSAVLSGADGAKLELSGAGRIAVGDVKAIL